MSVLPVRTASHVFLTDNTSHVLHQEQIFFMWNSRVEKILKMTRLPRSIAIEVLCNLKWDVAKTKMVFESACCNAGNLLKKLRLYTELLKYQAVRLGSRLVPV